MNGTENPHRVRTFVFRVLLVSAALALVFYVREQILQAESQRIEQPQRVALVDELPPPIEKIIPDEEFVDDEVALQEPQSEESVADENADPADDALGLDAEGLAGSDAFGLLAKKGGRDIMTLIGEQEGTRPDFRYYGGVVERYLEHVLAGYDELRSRSYKVVVKLWISNGGRIERCELVGSTGNTEIDARLREVLRQAALDEPPPQAMPQPIRVRVTSRSTG